MIGVWLLAGALAGPIDEGLDLLEQGQPADAVVSLEAAVVDGVPSGGLHYNLGLAWMAAGDAPRAVAHLRAARVAYPRDGDVSHNLALARSGLEGVPEPVIDQPAWTGLLTAGELGLLGWLLLMGVTAGGVRSVQRGSPRWPWLLGWLVSVVVLGTAWRGAVALQERPVLVVLDQSASARDVASVDGLEKHQLPAGSEVRVERRLGVFLLVVDGRGRRGWVPAAAGRLVGRTTGLGTTGVP